MTKRCKFCHLGFKTKNKHRKRCQRCHTTPADLLNYANRAKEPKS